MTTACVFLRSLLAGVVGLYGVSAGEPARLSASSDSNRVNLSQEEKVVELPAKLPDQLRRVLEKQKTLAGRTRTLHRAIQDTPDKKSRPEIKEEAQKLAAREQELVGEVSKIIAILEGEGSAVALLEVFQQLRDDMKRVQSRLEKGDFNAAAQVIEEDIVPTLEEMITALKRR